MKIGLVGVLGLVLTGTGWAIENDPWVLVCLDKPGAGISPWQNGLLHDRKLPPLADAFGLWTQTWSEDEDGLEVRPGWNSLGKEPVAYLHAIALAKVGRPAVRCWAPAIPAGAGPAPSLVSVVVLYVVGDRPFIYWGNNSCAARHYEFPGEWRVRMSWENGRLLTKAVWDPVGPIGAKGFLTDGRWQFGAVRASRVALAP